jgi:hypothetical protein
LKDMKNSSVIWLTDVNLEVRARPRICGQLSSLKVVATDFHPSSQAPPSYEGRLRSESWREIRKDHTIWAVSDWDTFAELQTGDLDLYQGQEYRDGEFNTETEESK